MKKRFPKIKDNFFSFIFLCMILKTNCIFSASSNNNEQTTPDINTSHNDYAAIISSTINDTHNRLEHFISTKKVGPEHSSSDSQDEISYTDGSCLFILKNKAFRLWDAATHKYYEFDINQNLIE